MLVVLLSLVISSSAAAQVPVDSMSSVAPTADRQEHPPGPGGYSEVLSDQPYDLEGMIESDRIESAPAAESVRANDASVAVSPARKADVLKTSPENPFRVAGWVDLVESGTIGTDPWSSCGCSLCDAQPCYCRVGDCHLFHDYYGIQVGGWAQAGILANPDSRFNTPVLFNDRADEILLNQGYLFAENKVVADGSRWDIGGRLDVTYGTDSRFLAVPGLERHRDGTRKWNSENDRYGVAMPQAFAEVAAPVAHGLSLKVGHFVSDIGVESVLAPYNYFYSRSYALVYGQPFTFTGGLATYQPSERIKMQLAYTSGWDVWNSLADTHGALFRVSIKSQDRRNGIAVTWYSGNDRTGVTAAGPIADDRHFLDILFCHHFSDRLRGLLQCDLGYQADAKVIVNPGAGTTTLDSAQWGGIAAYLLYQHNRQLVSALRAEWFNDADQSRLGIPIAFVPGGPVFEGGNYFALTAGLNFTPARNILLRPEVRWDYADLKGNGAVPGGDPTIRAFDSRTSSSQFTIGSDLVISF